MQDLGALIDYEYLIRLFNHCPESDMDVVLKKYLSNYLLNSWLSGRVTVFS